MNPDSPSSKKESYFQPGMKCISESGLKLAKDEDLNCEAVMTKTTDTITLINAFPEGLKAKSTFKFRIETMKNPYSMTPELIKIRTFVGIAENSGATSN